jgi:hypothetical protein
MRRDHGCFGMGRLGCHCLSGGYCSSIGAKRAEWWRCRWYARWWWRCARTLRLCHRVSSLKMLLALLSYRGSKCCSRVKIPKIRKRLSTGMHMRRWISFYHPFHNLLCRSSFASLRWGSLGDEQVNQLERWYVIKQADGRCTIASISPRSEAEHGEIESPTLDEDLEKWGPYTTQAEAIARRIGLIRAGKCAPA